MQGMTREQALQLLTQAAAAYRGTLEEHQTLQTALKVLEQDNEPAKAENQKK